ncbi:MAG: TIGR02234 family membrane protein [Mycobacterium sp.]
MIRIAQLLLVIAAGGLWAASRMRWVSVRSADGLGQPKAIDLVGATWSNALLPLALLLLAAAVAGLSVRGVWLRLVALLVAASCLVLGYLGVSLFVMPDVGPRGAALAGVPIATLVESQRYPAGAAITLGSAFCALVAAVLLMRTSAGTVHPSAGSDPVGSGSDTPGVSERGMWDALDEGRDPTDGDPTDQGR